MESHRLHQGSCLPFCRHHGREGRRNGEGEEVGDNREWLSTVVLVMSMWKCAAEVVELWWRHRTGRGKEEERS